MPANPDSNDLFDTVFSRPPETFPLVEDFDSSGPSVSSFELKTSMEAVSEFAGRMGFSVDAVLAAAFGYALSRWKCCRDSVFMVSKGGRRFPVMFDCSACGTAEYLGGCCAQYDRACGCGAVPDEGFLLSNGIETNVVFGDPVDDADISFSVEGGNAVARASERFSQANAMRLAGVFDKVLSGLLSCGRLNDIDYISEDDKALIAGFNDTGLPIENDTVVSIYEELISSDPGIDLVRYKDVKVSVRDSEVLTRTLAARINSMGAGRGDRVAIFLPRSQWHVLACLGIMRSGAAYVPIDMGNPDERAAYMIKDSGAKLVLVDGASADRYAAMGLGVPAVDVDSIVADDSSKLGVEVAKDDDALLIYTSGSTGMPKAVRITQGMLANMACGITETLSFPPYSVYGEFTNFSYVLYHMFIGAIYKLRVTIDLIPSDIRLDIGAMNAYYMERGITITTLTPQVAKLLATAAKETSIRYIQIGGEFIGDLKLPEALHCTIGYGSTENLMTTYCDLSSRYDMFSVGRVSRNCEAYVLDSEMRQVPVGAVGQLYLSGAQLTPGYLNNPVLNAEVILPNPFDARPGHDRLYATGDYGRYLPNGEIAVYGRRDGMVKIRGNRVELSEVESAVRSFKGVRDVTVQAVKVDGKVPELVAYVVSDGDVDGKALQAHVSSLKPAYMVPSYVMRIGKVPLNLSHKVDRSRLPVPDASSMRSDYAAPRNDRERVLCEAFSEVLGIKDVGIDDDFIALGGSSMKAAALLAWMDAHKAEAEAFSGMSVRPAEFLRLRTPRAICENLAKAQVFEVPFDEETGCPMPSSTTIGYVLMAMKGERNFSLPMVFGHPSWTDPERLRDAVVKAVESFPALRARLDVRGKELWLKFDRTMDIPILHGDFIEEFNKVIAPFDVYRDVFSRFYVCEDEGECRVLADIAHIVFDGRSVAPLISAVAKAYEGVALEKDRGLFIQGAYDRSLYGTEAFMRSRQLCAEYLAEGAKCSLSRHEGNNTEASFRYLFEAGLSDVRGFARECGVTDTGLLSSIFSLALSRYLGGGDVVYSLATGGRNAPGTEGSVGMLVKSVPVRAIVRDMPLKQYVKEQSARMMDAVVMDECSYVLSGVPVPDGMINFQYADYLEELLNTEYTVDINLKNPFHQTMFLICAEYKGHLGLIACTPETCEVEEVYDLVELFDRMLKAIPKSETVRDLLEKA